MRESEQSGFVLDCASPDVFSSPVIGGMQAQGDTDVINLVGTDDTMNRNRDLGRRQSRIPTPTVTVSSGGGQRGGRTSRLRVASHSKGDSMIPKPADVVDLQGEESVTESVSFGDGFTEYMNPLAEMSEDDGGVVEQQTNTVLRMQTPEAVQVLNNMSRPLGKKDLNVLDGYLRTGPKKLSPEPCREYSIIVPKNASYHVQGKENCDVECAGKDLDATRTKGSGVGRDDSSTDEEQQEVQRDKETAAERGDENNPSQEGVYNDVSRDMKGKAVTVVSPVMHGRQNQQDHHHQQGNDSVERVHFTLNNGCVHKTAKRTVSPVSFNLGSPDEAPQEHNVQKSFSFGMGNKGCGTDTTAEIVGDKKDEDDSGGESVDQPNPFTTMLGKLREEPGALQSPVVGTRLAEEDSNIDSPKSPSQCTPLNLISAASAGKDTPPERGTPPLGQGDVRKWIDHRGLTASITTPTRKDLEKMWGALKNINEATAAYQDAMRMNAQLHEDLAELQEAERQARTEAEEGNRFATQEMERSEEISTQIAELSAGVYTMFQRCDEERRQLSLELERAKQALSAMSSQSSNGSPEVESLCKELETIRVAEAEARAEAEQAKSIAHEYKAQLEEAQQVLLFSQQTDNVFKVRVDGDAPDDDYYYDMYYTCLQESMEDADVKDKVSYFEALTQHVAHSLEHGDRGFSPLEEPRTGHKAPQTTPVDVDDTTTPYRIHLEALQAFRQTVGDEDHSNDDACTDSESDYQVEEIAVSPIDMDGISRSALRQTIKARLLRLRTELQDAKDRLNHVEVGLHYKKKSTGDGKHSLLATEREDEEHAPALQETPGEDARYSPQVSPSLVAESISCAMATPTEAADMEDTFLPKGPARWDDDENLGSSDDEGEDHGEFTISANMGTMTSSRSRFARQIDPMSTPQAKLTTPRVGMSAIKSTAHYTPRFSSVSSSRSPSVQMYMEPITRPRRGGYVATRRSESEEKEFRRRAAALKIHVSPYFKKKTRSSMPHTNTEVDTML